MKKHNKNKQIKNGRLGQVGSFVLMKEVISIVLVMIMFVAMISSIVAVFSNMKTNDMKTIATRYAEKQLDYAKSIKWQYLGLMPLDNPPSVDTDNNKTAYIKNIDPSLDIYNKRLTPTSVVKIDENLNTTDSKGMELTARNYISWTAPKDGYDTNIDSHSQFGTKKITVVIEWEDKNGSHQVVQTTNRTSEISEATPKDVK
jgi:hypothetical protein